MSVRVATLYDVHGNLRALEAVLAEIPDDATIVVGGDVVAGGEQPRETLERLRSLGDRVRWLRGNADRELMPGEPGLAPPGTLDATRAELTQEQVDFLYGLPPSVRIGDVLYVHASPRNDEDIFTERTPEDRIAFLFSDVDAEIVASKRGAQGRPVIRLDRPVARGATLAVPRETLPELEEDEYYAFQLVGLVVEEEGGRLLGQVREVLDYPANDVLELDSGTSLPLVEACVRQVDLEHGRIVIAPGFADPE